MSKFVIGAEVVERRDYGYSAIKKINKVHKNGNFTIDGSTQQYRPYSDGVTAVATGSTNWSSPTVELVTDANRDKIKLSRQFSRARAILKTEAERLANLAANFRFYDGTGENVAVAIAEARKLRREISVYDWEVRRSDDPRWHEYARTPERATEYMHRDGYKVTPVYTIEEKPL